MHADLNENTSGEKKRIGNVEFQMIKNIISTAKMHKQLLAEYTLILIAGLATIAWLRGDLIVWKDWVFPMSSQAATRGFERSLFVWDSRMAGLGWEAPRFLQFIPYQFFLWSSVNLRIPLAFTNQILFYGLFALSGISMHFLLSTIVSSKKWTVARVAGSLFYMMNFYSLIFIWGGYLTGVNFAYSIFPLLVGLSVKAVESGLQIKYAFLLSLFWVLIGTSTGNPEITLLLMVLLFVYIFFDAVWSRHERSFWRTIRFALILSLVFLAVNAFWLLPNSFSANDLFRQISRASIGETDLQVFRLSSVPLFGALRLTGFWDLSSTYKGDYYYSWTPTLQQPVFQIISLLVPVFVFLPLLFVRKYDPLIRKYLVFFAVVSVFGLILMTGSNPPFGSVLEWIFQKVPEILRLYRFPYPRFGILAALGYSFLIAFGLQKLWELSDRTIHSLKSPLARIGSKIPFVVTVALIFMLLAYPFWTGDVIYSGGKITPSERVQLPSYYNAAADWFKQDTSNFNLMSLPLGILRYSVLQWSNGTHGYFGENPDMWLFDKPTIFYGDQGNGLAGQFAEALLNNNNFQLGSFDGWNFNYQSSNYSSAVKKFDNRYNAEVDLSRGGSVFLDRQNLYNIQKNNLNFSVTFKALEGDSLANLAFLYYDQNGYVNSTTSDTIQLGKSRPVITDLTKVSEIDIDKSWFASIDPNNVFDSWYFHTWKFTAPISIELNFEGSGDVDIVSNLGFTTQKTFVNNQSILLNIDPHDVEWIQPRIYVQRNEISQIRIRLVQASPQVNSLKMAYTDQSEVMVSLTAVPANNLLNYKPRIVLAEPSENQTSRILIRSSFLNGYDLPSNKLCNLLTLMNVKYLILHGDTNWEYIKDYTWWITTDSLSALQNALDAQDHLILLKQFGDLYIYLNTQWVPSHLHSACKSQTVNGDYSNLIETTTSKSWNYSDNVAFMSSQLDQSETSNLNSLPTDLSSKVRLIVNTVNPTKYVISVNSTGPFYLVFSETFDRNWVGYVENEQISQSNHFIGNYYANVWYINRSGSFSVTLEFWPQNLFYVGSAISLAAIFLCVAFMVWKAHHVKRS